jgi:hypothetical protein
MRALRMALGAFQNLSIAQLVTGAANRYGVDPGLAMSVAQRESGLNPNLKNPVTGATGVMQLMPATAASLGVTDIWDPVQNVNAGVRYLGQLISQFGDVVKGVAAYDWGPGRLSTAISQYGGDWLRHAPSETLNYVRDILGVTPDSLSPPAQAPPLTIDASTGLPIPDTTDVSVLPSANAPGMPTSGQILLLTALGAGVYLVADLLRE